MKLKININKIVLPLMLVLVLTSCEDFFEPTPEVVIKEKDFFAEWADFRTAEMGLYSIQQELVEQIVVLGELRGDLLEVTKNADAELLEVYNFDITPNNKYASPVNFYKLIANCNNLIGKITELQNTESYKKLYGENNTNYDRLNASVLAMRAWAYFNASRIYGKIPYVPGFLSEIDDIKKYINTGRVVVNEKMIRFGLTPGINGGISVPDTIRDSTIVLDRIWLDMYAVVDTFATQLETQVKFEGSGVDRKPVIGPDYNIDGVNDDKWEITTWNVHAYYCLLGQMYLTYDDLYQAEKNFHKIVYFSTTNNAQSRRYLCSFDRNSAWQSYFTSFDIFEHILALDFSKGNRQQNNLQRLFSPVGGNQYMLKPTRGAIFLWENDEWVGWRVSNNGTGGDNQYNDDRVTRTGNPGDWHRGNAASYAYYKDGNILSDNEMKNLLELRRLGKDKEVFNFMANVDTVVYKYNIGKGEYDRDVDFWVYRAGGIHLYMAEVLHRLKDYDASVERTFTATAQSIVNNGNYGYNSTCKGIRGRVSLGYENVPGVTDYLYIIHPYTGLLLKKGERVMHPVTGELMKSNEELGYRRYSGISAKRDAFEEYILKERAKEVGFEGERFYDIMRIAERRGKPEFLANKIAAKYRGERRDVIRNKLMDKANWFVPFDIGAE